MNSECYICKKHYEHGGKCWGKQGVTPCLLYDEDPRGKKVTVLLKLKLPIGKSLTTEIGRNLDNYIIKGVEKEITVKRILAIDWVLKPEVCACVIAECSYWEMENETDDTLADKAAIKERAKFEVIKGI